MNNKVTKSVYTQTLKKKLSKYKWLSWLLCFGTAALLATICIVRSNDCSESLKSTLGTALWTFLITNLPLVALAFIVKDKVKPVTWMINIVMGATVLPSARLGVYLVCAFWLIDTYIITHRIERLQERLSASIVYDERQ